MEYKSNIWDCENFALETFSEVRKQEEGNISPAFFTVLGRFNGKPHSINLVIVGDSWENLKIYLVEPQLKEKIWEPYVPPYKLQKDYYTFFNEAIPGQTAYFDKSPIIFENSEEGRAAMEMYRIRQIEDRDKQMDAVLKLMKEVGVESTYELNKYLGGYSQNNLLENYQVDTSLNYDMFLFEQEMWLEYDGSIKIRWPGMSGEYRRFDEHAELLPWLTQDDMKMFREHWQGLYDFELDYTIHKVNMWEKVRQEDRIFFVLA